MVLCDDCGSISSMDTTNYRGNIIAFLGAKDGRLSKVKINEVMSFLSLLCLFLAHATLTGQATNVSAK